MESRINKTIVTYIRSFKSDIGDKVKSMDLGDVKTSELMRFIFDYQKLTLKSNDFNKRKRLKNSIPVTNRCSACKANGDQCTRRRRADTEFCGTHSKGVPHGLIKDTVNSENQNQTVDIFGEDINGIIYYMDKFSNVYKMEDIMMQNENPTVIGEYTLINGVYDIKFKD
jgi:hypothetical protein